MISKTRVAVLPLMFATLALGCSGDAGRGEPSERPGLRASPGEEEHGGGEEAEEGHDEPGKGGEHEGGVLEESGVQLAPNQRHETVRGGVRLILAFDSQAHAFVGTVENVIDTVLERVRVEVHLSDGRELGPTDPVDLAPGEKRSIRLDAPDGDFEAWTAHAEVGFGEHGRGRNTPSGSGKLRWTAIQSPAAA